MVPERVPRARPLPLQSDGCCAPPTWILRVRLKVIGNLETMHDSDLPTFLIISLPIIFKRTVRSRYILQ